MKSLELLLSILLTIAAGAQETLQGQGLEVNDSVYNSIESANMLYGAALPEAAPKNLSLRMYCPLAPVTASGGLIWTAAISKAMSIMLGYGKQWSREQVENQAFSPYFLFDMLPKVSIESCGFHKEWIKQTQDLLVNIGNVKLTKYSQGAADCHNRPSELLNKVDRYLVRAMTRLFVNNPTDDLASIGQKQFVIKRCLGRKHPVVLCIMADEGFVNLKTDVWAPGSCMKSLQTVVVTGYDDQRQAFEITHPIGKNWGKGGFAWIRYADLGHAKYAFEFTMEDRPVLARESEKNIARHQKSNTGTHIPDRSVLYGTLVLNSVNTEGNYIPVALTSHPAGYYEPDRRYDVLSQFQLLGTGAAKSYVYVLGVDPDGKAQLHYPHQKEYKEDSPRISSAMLSEAQSQVVIPEPILTYDVNGNQIRKEQVFIKERQGTDWLAAIFSNKRMDREITVLIRELDGHSTDFLSRFQQVFGKYLKPKSMVNFEKDHMKFKSSPLPDASLVPVILKLEGN
ncbi:hypothetical protein LXM25_16235 [Dyadobacter sp. LJ53]|uniref:hypothetical protein n=1 Tax=Dyadobacter chenwenxiniae TaxID=2906456 RepID=UPI001F2A77C1|nr:hypothetical protein [Dyadobacter chenwenxiniae]MCF0051618.1 hypothetical protein [Dyadobacter chenwenxiniae]